MSANDGGIKRGDRADTGDNQARPTQGAGPEGSAEIYSESGLPTGDPSSIGADVGPATSRNEEIDGGADSLGTDVIDDLTVRDATDPSLGLTDIEGIPPDDWAANSGPTRTPEGENPVAFEPSDPELDSCKRH